MHPLSTWHFSPNNQVTQWLLKYWSSASWNCLRWTCSTQPISGRYKIFQRVLLHSAPQVKSMASLRTPLHRLSPYSLKLPAEYLRRLVALCARRVIGRASQSQTKTLWKWNVYIKNRSGLQDLSAKGQDTLFICTIWRVEVCHALLLQ